MPPHCTALTQLPSAIPSIFERHTKRHGFFFPFQFLVSTGWFSLLMLNGSSRKTLHGWEILASQRTTTLTQYKTGSITLPDNPSTLYLISPVRTLPYYATLSNSLSLTASSNVELYSLLIDLLYCPSLDLHLLTHCCLDLDEAFITTWFALGIMAVTGILVLGSGMVAWPCVEYLVRNSKNKITIGILSLKLYHLV